MRAIDQLYFLNLLEKNGFQADQQFYSDAIGELNRHVEDTKNAPKQDNYTPNKIDNNAGQPPTMEEKTPTQSSIEDFYKQHTQDWLQKENEKAPEVRMPNLPYEDRDYDKFKNLIEGGGEIPGVGELYKTPQAIQGRARANAYSDILNAELKKKNPKVYKEIEDIQKSGMSATDKNKMAEQVASEHPDFYLGIDEQKKALGKNYEDFKELLPVYASDFAKNVYGSESGRYSTTGELEDPMDYQSTKWGARSAVAISPVALKYRITNEPHKYSDRYSEKYINLGLKYNPETRKYSSDTNIKVKDTVTGSEVPFDEKKYGSENNPEFTKQESISDVKKQEKEYRQSHPEKFQPTKYRDIVKKGMSVGREINPEYTEWMQKYGGK